MKFFLSPKDLLQYRFKSQYPHIIRQIPKYGIISFFPNTLASNTPLNPKLIQNLPFNITISQSFPWLQNFAKLSILKINHNSSIFFLSLSWGIHLASMILEELIFSGAKYILSIGFAATINSKIQIHDLVIPTQSINHDGISNLYFPHSLLSKSSPKIIPILQNICSQNPFPFHLGTHASFATPYRQNVHLIRQYQKKYRLLSIDMEASSLFAIAQYHQVHLASLFSISDTLNQKPWKPHFKSKLPLLHSLTIAIQTLLQI